MDFLPHWWPGGGLHFVVRLPLASAEEVTLSTGLRQQKRVAMPVTSGADAHSMTSDLPQLLPGFLFCGPGHWVELGRAAGPLMLRFVARWFSG